MTIKNADMPAMPVNQYKRSGELEVSEMVSAGMSKREMMAMAAMQGLLSKHGDDDYDKLSIATYSVQHADALLAELERTNG